MIFFWVHPSTIKMEILVSQRTQRGGGRIRQPSLVSRTNTVLLLYKTFYGILVVQGYSQCYLSGN